MANKKNKDREDLIDKVLSDHEIFYTNTPKKVYKRVRTALRQFGNKCVEFEKFDKTLKIIANDIDCHSDVKSVGEFKYNPILKRFEINDIVFIECVDLFFNFFGKVQNEERLSEYFIEFYQRSNYLDEKDYESSSFISVNIDWVNPKTLNLTVTFL